MIKQIYSLVNYNESVETMKAGADHIGLVPMQSGGVPAHRVPYDVVDQIFSEAKRRGVKSVAIMLNKDPEEMIFIAKRVKPDIVHIAGMEFTADELFAKRLHEECPGVQLMQAVLVDGPEAVDRAIKYSQYCDLLLTDSGLAADTGIGASGEVHDWGFDAKIVESVDIPVIVAGGLGPDNVEECIKKVKPYGVDSLTKTSYKFKDGIIEKDLNKVQDFCKKANFAAKEMGL
ncbi:phosphoribosylanthranilate isomerase [Tetragenococcus halophilus]|uniref:phosphoribosylanthranilate isomerase n=1 Tax=Tetragenococcus halophilus TaxID=51669 RepID=UPI00209A6502|nr:phosphoribosylanthranilate isomerase [Tetragenococcus halophilus]MCO8289759.1 phosphoribosylanthranilate isomerase [Tetragenococcus halophilus]MCO8294341.1 phosphoribosylanthranilate isomerase [Tetragenococcus halophilus]